ncbi:Lycopene cyclase, CruA type [Richelia intracellularis HH01]|uniref:Lycopene cyclase, CruA type n=1 Tax=Richelia intracellularis HH01 TaxID=1165094 RepID=M1X6M4_9NOST|nr:Lycopene cyclase CruA type [Richelia intracellularis]CCH68271.1 Lycopene cyclase, CruA type [Richelia intracellularis HH01]HAE05865.1 flavin-dependent dehydrogenase [Richelia sp.]
MEELLYLEIPTSDITSVINWLQEDFKIDKLTKKPTPSGIRLVSAKFKDIKIGVTESLPVELSIFVWYVQRTTYLKVFQWGHIRFPRAKEIIRQLTTEINNHFPHEYSEPPVIELSKQSIFEALSPYYPLTVKYFQQMPRGEYDLQRVYWWEQQWRKGVKNPQNPKQVVFERKQSIGPNSQISYDLIYIGGALGVIHAAVMARLGYKVLLVERLSFGRMNREWNISRDEIQSLINLGLLTNQEVESIIVREYKDGFNKFFDGNNPNHLRAPILYTPRVLNIALDSEKLLQLCGAKLKAAGGDILDETEFIHAEIDKLQVDVTLKGIPSQQEKVVSGRVLVDAMGTASPIAWQLNGIRTFDSVCPTVGAVIDGGFEPGVWDSQYGDVLNSHGDISRGRQLIWELFPGKNEELTVYLFHYHQVNYHNPGSLLEMYEDFFTILPEYRRCNLEKLVWKKPTFGYIPGHFSTSDSDRIVASERLLTIGDAASLQSPLVFTGFGSLVRNLERLTTLLNVALKHDLLSASHLNKIHAFQSNAAVTWIFSKGMMVPTGKFLPPQRINVILNNFFGLLADEPPEVADDFIKDKFSWLTFNRLALKAAFKNPALLLWIYQMAGLKDMLCWGRNYINFTCNTIISGLLNSWFSQFLKHIESRIKPHNPGLWLRLLAINYVIYANKPKR